MSRPAEEEGYEASREVGLIPALPRTPLPPPAPAPALPAPLPTTPLPPPRFTAADDDDEDDDELDVVAFVGVP